MKKIMLLLSIVATICVLQSCKTPTKISGDYAFNTFNSECLGIDLDGSQTLRAWGKGNNRADAIEQAKRNALRDVIFKGITEGSGECNTRPLLTEVNAQEKYERYFNAFFAKNGAYLRFVKLDETRTSRIKAKNATQESFGVVVTVNRVALREQLINDNILKP